MRIDRYEVTGELGRGGMGVVYRATDLTLHRDVAIKLIGSGTGPVPDDLLARFLREARAVARIRHPDIVAVHEIGRHEGSPFLVMDLIEGESFIDELRRGRPAPRRAAEVTLRVARALEHAHEQGIVHRDVKPHNVLIDAEGHPRLADFGLARDLGATDASLTASGQVVGTPAYMAPEQASGQSERHGPATDVYGVGALLYHAITGSAPFRGESMINIVAQVLFHDPVPPRRIDPSIHPDLETIALRCLAKAPERRLGSAGAVADELERFLRGEAIEARPIGRGERVGRWLRRNPLLASLVGALVLVGVGGLLGGLHLYRESRLADLRAEARDAIAELARVRDAPGDREFDDLLGPGLAAVEATGRLVAMTPGDTEARASAFGVAVSLAESASAAEQWSVAAFALDRAGALRVDAGRVGAARAELERARLRADAERRSAVARIVDDVESGAVEERRDGLRDTVIELVGLRHPETAREVAERLDRITERVRQVTRSALLEVAAPTVEEERAGEGEIVGLAAILDRFGASRPSESIATVDAPAAEVVARAERRLVARERRRVGRSGSARDVLAAVVATRVGEAPLRAAELWCSALGSMSIREHAVDALARHLAEVDERHAIAPALALCRLGGERALGFVIEARTDRFGTGGPYWRQVARALPRASTGDTPPVEGPSGGARASTESMATEAASLTARGDYQEAIEVLTRAIELDPRDAALWQNRGNVRSLNGEAEAAIADLDRAIERAPKWAPAWNARGGVRYRAGELVAASVDLTRAIELDEALVEAWANRGCCRREQGDLEGAIADLSRAVALDPGFAKAWSDLAAARKARGDLDEAIADATRAITLDGGLAEAFTHRSAAHRAAGDARSALDDASRAVQLDPGSEAALIARGLARAAEDPEGAIDDFTRAIELDPERPEAWSCRGSAKLRLRDGAGAVSDLGEAIDRAPGDARFWLNRGNAWLHLSENERAIADLDAALQRDSGLAEAWSSRGVARYQSGDPKGAIADYSRAVEVDPEMIEARLNRALAHRALGENVAAVADASAVIERAPRHAIAWSIRGSCRLALGRVDDAIDDLTHAIELDASLSSSWYNRGVARLTSGQVDEAIADFTRAIELEPTFEGPLAQRGQAKATKGDVEGAIADWERVLEIAPDGRAAAFVRPALEKLRAGRSSD